MRIPKQTLTLAAVVAVCGLFLASCGGGSSTTTINGNPVPPEPDATQNNATLAGVDSNANGVRDDIERKIAATTASGDKQTFTKSIAIAQAYELIIQESSMDINKATQIKKSIMCATSLSGSNASGFIGYSNDNYEESIFNTDNREQAYKIYNDIAINIDPLDIAKLSSDGEIHCD